MALYAENRAENFLTTRWSVIQRAAGDDESVAIEALNYLCGISWYPIYAFIRRDGKTEDEAKDLTQGFFEHLLSRDLVAKADGSRGRFRTFLIRSLQNFLRDQWRQGRALKRGREVELVSLDLTDAEGRYLHEPVTNDSPDQLFERAWARNLLDTTREQLREEFLAADELKRFEVLHDSVFGDGEPYSVLAGRLGMTEGGIKTAVRRMRARFEFLLRRQVRELVQNSEELDDELQFLVRRS